MDLSSRAKKVEPTTAPAAAAGTSDNNDQKQQQPPVSVDQIFARKELISKPETRASKKAKKEDVSGAAGKKNPATGNNSPFGKKKRHLSHKKDPIARDEVHRTVFVGNLPNTVTHAQVERFFEQKCGGTQEEPVVEAARVRCVHLAPITEGERNRGRGVRILRGEIEKSEQASATAYVVFKTVEGADQAISVTGSVFKGRHLSIGGETPEAKAFAPRSSVYLGNLPYNVTDEQIWRFFIDHELADVTRVRIPRDHNNTAWGNAKGFGYVEFQSRESVVKALKLREPKLEERKIRIFSVHKSKDAISGQVTRREKRAVVASSAGKKTENNNNNKEGNKAGAEAKNVSNGSRGKKTAVGAMALNAQAHETPSWMGETTDPRKKLSKELRWLSQHPNDRKAAAKARHKDRTMATFAKKKKAAKAAESKE